MIHPKYLQKYNQYIKRERQFKRTYQIVNHGYQNQEKLIHVTETTYNEWLALEEKRLQDNQFKGYRYLRESIAHHVGVILTSLLIILCESITPFHIGYILIPFIILSYTYILIYVIIGLVYIYQYRKYRKETKI